MRLRLVYSRNDRTPLKPSLNSGSASPTYSRVAAISQKLERLQQQKPGMVAAIDELIDDLLRPHRDGCGGRVERDEG